MACCGTGFPACASFDLSFRAEGEEPALGFDLSPRASAASRGATLLLLFLSSRAEPAVAGEVEGPFACFEFCSTIAIAHNPNTQTRFIEISSKKENARSG
jgi:hypothetical protein